MIYNTILKLIIAVLFSVGILGVVAPLAPVFLMAGVPTGFTVMVTALMYVLLGKLL